MKLSLQEINDWLNQKEKHLIEVFGSDGEQQLQKKMSAQLANDQYGGFFKYLEGLYTQGITKIFIARKEKYGSSTAKRTVGFPYTLSRNGTEATSQRTTESHTQNMGLGFPNNFQGLSGGVIMDNYAKAMRYEELIAENTRLKTKLETAQTNCQQLQRENDKHEISKEAAPGIADQTVKSLLNPEVIKGIAQMFVAAKTNTPPPIDGLTGSPSTGNKLKDDFIDFLKRPDVTEKQANLALHVLIQAVENNQPFVDQVVSILPSQIKNQQINPQGNA